MIIVPYISSPPKRRSSPVSRDHAGSGILCTPVRVKYCTAMTRRNHNKRKTRGNKSKPYEASIFRDIQTARRPSRIVKTLLSVNGTIASDGSGVIAGAISLNPSGSSEWSSWATLYDQFRVIGGVLNLVCWRALNDTGSPTIVRFAFDNDSSATPTAYSDVMQFAEVHDVTTIWTSGTVRRIPFKRPMKKGTPQTAQMWYDESSPSSIPGSLKYYGSGANASTGFFKYILDLVVEFQLRS